MDESETEVAISAFVTERRPVGLGCTDDLQIETVEVHLDAPLRERDLRGCDLAEDSYFTVDNAPRDRCSDIVGGF